MPTDPSQSSSQRIPYKVDALLSQSPSQTSAELDTSSRIIRLNASAIADARIGVIENGSIILNRSTQGYKIIAAGSKEQVDAQHETMIKSGDLSRSMMELTLNDRLVMPALVNAHTHLDLTHIGPVEHNPNEGFVQWVNMIRDQRKTDDPDIRHAVRLGIQRSLAGGTIAVGDIAGAPGGRLTDAPAHELASSPIWGVSYLEFFGIGKTSPAAIQKIQHYLTNIHPKSIKDIERTGVQIGLQPHAPNTVDLGVYRWATAAAASRSMPLSTHLAETPEEREFIAQGSGPQREMLERFGIWDNSILDHITKDNHPVGHLAEILNESPYLVAHVNDATDAAIEALAKSQAVVAYCPRGSSYFGADQHFGPHRYPDMIEAGVPVCLGTDSIVNLDTPDRISILDEMRFLARRDGTDPKTLLQMATINGGASLGLNEESFTLSVDAQPFGLISIPIKPGQGDSWTGAMQGDEPPEWVFLRGK